MYGFGLLKGLKITMKKFFQKKVTQQYPDVQPDLPVRSHGSFKFDFDKCISCNMCADACPNSVIRVDFTKDEKGKRVLQKYNMSLGYCLFCGLCVKACPKDAINFSTDFHMTCFDKVDTSYYWSKPEEQGVKEEIAVDSSAETAEKGLEV